MRTKALNAAEQNRSGGKLCIHAHSWALIRQPFECACAGARVRAIMHYPRLSASIMLKILGTASSMPCQKARYQGGGKGSRVEAGSSHIHMSWHINIQISGEGKVGGWGGSGYTFPTLTPTLCPCRSLLLYLSKTCDLRKLLSVS